MAAIGICCRKSHANAVVHRAYWNVAVEATAAHEQKTPVLEHWQAQLKLDRIRPRILGRDVTSHIAERDGRRGHVRWSRRGDRDCVGGLAGERLQIG